MKEKPKKRRKLNQSILRICMLFTMVIIIGIGTVGIVIFTNGTINAYKNELSSAIDYAELQINTDAIKQNIETMTVNDCYIKTQKLLHQLTDTHGLQYLYIILPTDGQDIGFLMTNEDKGELKVNDKINISPGSVGLKILSKINRNDKLSEYFIDSQKKEKSAYYVSYSKECGYLYSKITSLIDDNGEIVAFLGADVSIQEMVVTVIEYIVFLFVGILVVSGLFLWSLYLWIKKRVTVPIQKMDESARGFISESHKDTDVEKLEFPALNINTGDEIEGLSNSLCKMSNDIKKYLTRIIIQTKEEEKILSELNVAKKIQEEMLPRKFPPFPEYNQFEILASISPAKQVGGDFYDFFFVDENHLALVIADVSDKGVPAALFMAISKALIKNRALLGGSPSEIFADVNSQLCEGNDSNMFVTAWLCIIDITNGHAVVSNAGHEDPAVCSKDGHFELKKLPHSLPLGAIKNMQFFEHEFELHAGDTVFTYTDGVIDATDKNEDRFGIDRMIDALNKPNNNNIHDIFNSVNGALDEYVSGAPQFDDITMLGFTYFGSDEEQ